MVVDIEAGIVEGAAPIRFDRYPKIRCIWGLSSVLLFILSLPFYYLYLLEVYNRVLSQVMLLIISIFTYMCFMYYVIEKRELIPYILRRSEKQLFESGLVFVCSCWVYYTRGVDDLPTISGLIVCFKAIPIINLWFSFQNFGLAECFLMAIIEYYLFSYRTYNIFVLIVIAGIGNAMMFIKNAVLSYLSNTKEGVQDFPRSICID